MKRLVTVSVTATVATAFVVTSAATASAAGTTTCRATLGATTVGNLVVPDGATCTLSGTAVRGSVTVGVGATLRASGARISGGVTANWSDAVYLSRTNVRATVSTRGMDSGTGVVEPPNARPVYLRINDRSNIGGVSTRGTQLDLSGSSIEGSLSGNWGAAASLSGMRVVGRTVFTNSYGGHITLCGSRFGKSVTISTGRFGAFLGQDCAGNLFRSSLTVDKMTGVRVSNNTMRGSASGVNYAFMAATGIVGGNNTFSGARRGDFTLPQLTR